MRVVPMMFAVAVAAVAVVSVPAMAQELNKPEVAQEFLEEENPHVKKLNARNEKLVETLGEAELKNLYHIRETFGMVRAVGLVRQDVQGAMKACAKENPDMKKDLDAKFKEWTATIDPAVAAQDKAIDAAIDAQPYMKPKEVRDYLKLLRQTAEHANKSIDKKYVTEKSACETLLVSMDKTREALAQLLSEITIPAYNPDDKIPAESNVKSFQTNQ